ncbi:MAG TPA: polysaccharide deacetylase family protein [Baekduia sp.]|uniref:polysaccharide deacetylase family protein n=1 Tax=Baekduia sp. TaxID=2600305 RepID=UPI002D78831B|nr:polysaccharide deacetylase family protein [Baekduia sp.]HET6507973.1 polysaccharide deacetylase family protein [Baekduia sp.]
MSRPTSREIDELVPYSAIVDRPPLRWPGGARLALLVIPNIEFYEFEPPANPYKNPYPRFPTHPDVVWYGHRDHGNRVGFWRMLDLFDRYRLPATASLNVAVLEHFPEIREAMVERGWELMSHGLYNTRYLYGLSEAQERALYAQTLEIAERTTGQRLRGMLGPGFTSTSRTPALLAEAGFTYCMDWFIDDQPFPMVVPEGRLVGVPYAKEINDAFLFGGHPFFGFEGPEFAEMCRDQFDRLYAEGGRVMTLALHPYLISQPYRQRYLEEVLEHMLSHEDVWVTTAGEVADHYLAHYHDDALARSVVPAAPSLVDPKGAPDAR